MNLDNSIYFVYIFLIVDYFSQIKVAALVCTTIIRLIVFVN